MNPVIEETGVHARGKPIMLIYFNGAPVPAHGLLSRLKETGAMLGSPLSKGSWQCWVPTPENPPWIEFVEAGGVRYRVIDRETIDTRDRTGQSTTRFQLQAAEGMR